MRHAVICCVVLVLGAVCFGGVVTLKDGTVLEGKIRPTPGGFVVVDANGKATTVAAGDVVSMQPDKPGGGAGGSNSASEGGRGAEGDLASLRRAMTSVRDAKVAVDRYTGFIDRQPGGSGSAADARKDLGVWQDRLDRKLVRVGDDWLTAGQVAQRQQQGVAIAREIAPLLSANQYAQAEAAVNKGIAAAPGNASILYLQGLVLFHENKMVPARKSFEQVEAALPEHAATHNNLAVILWQTRSQMPAMGQYEKAMLAEPGNQDVLDNVAEALHALPPAAAKNELVRKVLGLFSEQDAALAKKILAEKNLMRFGAEWISADEYKALEGSRSEAQQKLDQYRKESNELPAQLNSMDQDIALKTNAMKAMVQESSGVDAYGRMVYSQLPVSYYNLKQDVEKLTAERVLKQRRLEQLPKLVADSQQQLAAAQGKYRNQQSIMGEGAMPGALPPATQPTSRPG
jgi:tetratricopeptide (TPR) repeat protein